MKPGLIAAAAVAAAFLVGVEYSSFFPAGPDQSGYVSQAHRWVTGQLRAPLPEWALGQEWTNALVSAAPVGYAIDGANRNLVPSYAPGLPLAMAVFERLGGADAVFYVVPLFGSIAVWATYVLGKRLAGPWAGAISAVLLICSPAFLWMLIEPMSDVPAAACWTVALVFALRARSGVDGLLSGIGTAAAIMIRPNVAPLACFPAALLLLSPNARMKKIAAFALAAIPAAVAIAVVNARWYGSPLKSGYGSLETLYALEHVPVNAQRYLGWLVQTQTPLVFLGTIAAFVVPVLDAPRRLILILIYPLAVLASYLPYLNFDEWSYLRFLLPAYPVVLSGLAAVLVTFAERVRPRQLGVPVAAVVTLSLALYGLMFARDVGTFRVAIGEVRFAHAVDLARTLPRNSIFVSDAYSGALHLYTGHDVLRWVMIPENNLDVALVSLGHQGYRLYFIGDAFEVQRLKREYAHTEAATRFDPRREVVYGELFVVADLTPP